LLTGASDFDGILRQANGGDHRTVDMLVRDIYGQEQPLSLGLDLDLTASCLAKVARAPSPAPGEEAARRADIAASLLQMIAYNIAQIACLNARLHNINRVFFAGFFLRGQPATMGAISKAVSYWGRGGVQAHFLRHEGYLGAVGAFLHSMPGGDEATALPVSVSLASTSIAENFIAHEFDAEAGGPAVGSLRSVRRRVGG
jgi:type II pantothenate kinase